MATVNIVSVSKFYDNHPVLDNVNISIERGEFVAVIGPSGCGKSTLLRLVAGLDEVSSGNILINAQCVNKIHPSKRDMAMVFQNYALYPHMTVYENMAYGLKMRGMKKKEISQRVHEVGELLQLCDDFHRKPIYLSGGQRQRVAMGRAIVRSPSVFLFDEPLSNLDAQLRTEMRHEIKKLHQQLNTTCLYVTHDQTEAMTMADKIVVLNKGSVEQIGTPRELYQHPASLFVAGFIGHYPMNFIPATIDLNQGIILKDIGMSLPLPNFYARVSSGDPVIVGIRSEHLNVSNTHGANSLSVKREFVDDMGADQLIQVVTDQGHLRLLVRVPGDIANQSERFLINIAAKKANLFCHQTGKQLGEWSE